MNCCSTLTLTTVALGLAISPPAFAQEKQQVSFNTPAENSRYTEKTENLELGRRA